MPSTRAAVTLTSMRPKGYTDLESLKAALEEGSRAALPQSLPEPLLIALARDLRNLERMWARTDDDAENQPWLVAPMAALFCLLSQQRTRGGGFEPLQIPFTALPIALQAYQWAVEREIVGRVTGVCAESDEAALLAALRTALEPSEVDGESQDAAGRRASGPVSH